MDQQSQASAGVERESQASEHQTDQSPRLADRDVPLVAIAVAAAVLLTWALQLPSSLWIDELGTFWVIDGDLSSTADRAWRFHGQTPLYYTLLWSVTELFGSSEIVLRLPSLVSMVLAALLVYRLAARHFGHGVAWIALATFVVFPGIGTHASDARPYALALLATLVATTALDAWLTTPALSRALIYGLAAAAVIYVHYVFATVLFAHGLYFVWCLVNAPPEVRSRLWRGAALASAVGLLAISPTFPQVAALLARRDELVFSNATPLPTMIAIWAPATIGVILVGTLVALVSTGARMRRVRTDPLVLLVLGFATPPLVLFLLAQVTDIVLWTSRYWLAATPYGAILFAVLIASGLRDGRAVKAAALALLLVGILTGTSVNHSAEDWRGAVSSANMFADEQTPLLVFTGLIELTNADFLVDPEKMSYVTSPLAYYRTDGSVVPLPWTSPDDQAGRLGPIMSQLAQDDTLVVIANRSRGSAQLMYIAGWLTANGYDMQFLEAFGEVRVAAFMRA